MNVYESLAEDHLHSLLDDIYAESRIAVDAYPDFDQEGQGASE